MIDRYHEKYIYTYEDTGTNLDCTYQPKMRQLEHKKYNNDCQY